MVSAPVSRVSSTPRASASAVTSIRMGAAQARKVAHLHQEVAGLRALGGQQPGELGDDAVRRPGEAERGEVVAGLEPLDDHRCPATAGVGDLELLSRVGDEGLDAVGEGVPRVAQSLGGYLVEPLPGEVGPLVLRAGEREVEPDEVARHLGDQVGAADQVVAAGGELLVLQLVELVADVGVGGEVAVAVGEQHDQVDHAPEVDVVESVEVDQAVAALGAPGLVDGAFGLAVGLPGAVDRGGHRLDPGVEDLTGGLGERGVDTPSGRRHRDRDLGERAGQDLADELPAVLPPGVLAGGVVRGELLPVVLDGQDQDGDLTRGHRVGGVEDRARVAEVVEVVGVAAALAGAAAALGQAGRALALDQAVEQVGAGVRGVRHAHRAELEAALLVEGGDEVEHGLPVGVVDGRHGGQGDAHGLDRPLDAGRWTSRTARRASYRAWPRSRSCRTGCRRCRWRRSRGARRPAGSGRGCHRPGRGRPCGRRAGRRWGWGSRR